MSYERITKHSSPNFTKESSALGTFGVRRRISGVTIHHWGDPRNSPTFSGVISWLCNKASGVSAHAVIEAGKVAYLVNYSDVAWHAGSARGNATTIGLELNPRASNADYDTAAEHIADIWVTYGKLPLYPHKHWKATACPGRWDLNRLKALATQKYNAKKGIGSSSPKPRPATLSHKVKAGETLWKLSVLYNTTVEQIAKENKIKDPSKIYKGQNLKITVR